MWSRRIDAPALGLAINAAAAIVNGWCESPVTVVLPNAGDLLVELDGELDARLTGPVEEICRGEALAL